MQGMSKVSIAAVVVFCCILPNYVRRLKIKARNLGLDSNILLSLITCPVSSAIVYFHARLGIFELKSLRGPVDLEAQRLSLLVVRQERIA